MLRSTQYQFTLPLSISHHCGAILLRLSPLFFQLLFLIFGRKTFIFLLLLAVPSRSVPMISVALGKSNKDLSEPTKRIKKKPEKRKKVLKEVIAERR